VLISEAKRRRDAVIVLSSKLSPQSFPEEPGDGELTMYGAHSTRQETTIWLTFPDANKIIIGQPDLKYHKIERTGSDNQKRSPSNILPSSLFWVRMMWVGLEREVFLDICSEMASREEGH
jgi:hypothetical protein